MKNLAERIEKGEQAIAKARAGGRDVAGWTRHLDKLRREAEHQRRVTLAEYTEDDVGRIIDVWRRVFGGFSESRERITAHLAQLERWQNKKIEKARRPHAAAQVIEE